MSSRDYSDSSPDTCVAFLVSWSGPALGRREQVYVESTINLHLKIVCMMHMDYPRGPRYIHIPENLIIFPILTVTYDATLGPLTREGIQILTCSAYNFSSELKLVENKWWGKGVVGILVVALPDVVSRTSDP